jgi:uncharacterized membrane protein
VTETMLLAIAGLLALVLWFTFRIDVGHRAVVTSEPVERVKRSLRERLARGELNTDEFRRLTALMQLQD